jgi:hypothetical protein
MPRFLARVELLIDAEDENQAHDVVSAFLTETGMYDGVLVSWQYSGVYFEPHFKEAPSDADFQ